jgi:SAM-dependent methyltransferase
MHDSGSTLGIDAGDAERVAAAVARFLPPGLAGWFDARFVRSDRLFDDYVSCLAARIVRELRLDEALAEEGTAGDAVVRAGLDPRCGVVPVEWMLRHLAARGLLAVRTDASGVLRFRAGQLLPVVDPATILAEQQRHDASSMPSYALADAAAAAYPAFLAGKRSGEEILLAPARLALWSRYFSNEHPLYAVNNRVGAAALVAIPDDDGPDTVLELGAGLGSGTAAALEALATASRFGSVRTYHVTDLVPAFLRTAQRRTETQFPDVRGLTFAALDIDQPFGPQGVAPASVSIVYAVNTLHVAHDLAVTLGEIRRALRPGGHLVFAECIRPLPGQTLYPEFVFNLLSKFRAPRLHAGYRPQGGFLTPEQWTAALEAEGFADVHVLPDIAALRSVTPAFSVGAITASRVA